jgi:hypothetical protein
MLAGLADEGIGLAGADLVVGTSAGAIVGAQVTSGASLAGLYQAQLPPPGADRARPAAGQTGRTYRARARMASWSRWPGTHCSGSPIVSSNRPAGSPIAPGGGPPSCSS